MTEYTVQGLLTTTDKMEMERRVTRLMELWCCSTRDSCFVPVNHSTHTAPPAALLHPCRQWIPEKRHCLFLLITTNSLFTSLAVLWNCCALLEISGFSCLYFSKSKTVLTLTCSEPVAPHCLMSWPIFKMLCSQTSWSYNIEYQDA